MYLDELQGRTFVQIKSKYYNMLGLKKIQPAAQKEARPPFATDMERRTEEQN
jgi:hypothetical protein